MFATKILQPSALLRPFIHHYWIMRADGFSMEMNIMPMGCMKWMFYRSRPFTVNGHDDYADVATVCGQYDEAVHVATRESIDLLFVFFQPFAMKTVMGMPCGLFQENNVDMDCLGLPGFKLLKRQVLEAMTDGQAVGHIESFILHQLACHYDDLQFRQMRAVFGEIGCHPYTSTGRLADIACLSERQFRRVFSEQVGLSPKQMLRVRRFLLASRQIQAGTADFTSIIHRLGYTDHSHFYKDFRDFSGMSPTDYMLHIRQLEQRRMLDAYRSYHEE